MPQALLSGNRGSGQTEQGSKPILEQAKKAFADSRPRNRRVLVVESDPELQWKLARLLTVDGNRVVGTSSGDGALTLLGHWEVDLVLLASELPAMRGLELADILRERLPDVPLILMAQSDQEVARASLRSDIAACLMKPFRFEALRAMMDSVIESVQLTSVPAE